MVSCSSLVSTGLLTDEQLMRRPLLLATFVHKAFVGQLLYLTVLILLKIILQCKYKVKSYVYSLNNKFIFKTLDFLAILFNKVKVIKYWENCKLCVYVE